MTTKAPPRLPGKGGQVRMPTARKLNPWEIAFRLLMVVVILGSVGLAWWALTQQLVPLQKQSRDLTASVSRLSTDVDTLARKWSSDDTEHVQKSFGEVHQRLFASQAAFEEWVSKLQEDAIRLGLDPKIDIGQAALQTNYDFNLAIVPASISLDVRPRSDVSE